MQTLGVLLLTAAVWIIYCGVTGVPPWDTFMAIMREPARASEIIAEARDAATSEIDSKTSNFRVTDVISGGDLFTGKWKITDDWNDHVNRKGDERSEGGVDFAMPVGTALPSMFPGVLTNNPSGGSGGYTASVKLDNGWRLEYLHLSKFVPQLDGKRVKAGTIIGYSGGAAGATGSGSSTGAHVHIHMYNPQGQRVDYREYLKENAA